MPVVILTTQGCAKSLWDALLAGAHGYWVKGGTGDEVMKELVPQMRKVLTGKLALCDQAGRLLPQAFALMRERPADQWGLSRREEAVMLRVCEHQTDKEIATGLSIADETVHVHLRHAFKKLGVHGRKAAASKYLDIFPGEARKEP